MSDWSQYAHYYCIVCGETCINHVEDSCTQQRECRKCNQIPDLQATPTAAAGESEEGATASTHQKRGPSRGDVSKRLLTPLESSTSGESHDLADSENRGEPS